MAVDLGKAMLEEGLCSSVSIKKDISSHFRNKNGQLRTSSACSLCIFYTNEPINLQRLIKAKCSHMLVGKEKFKFKV